MNNFLSLKLYKNNDLFMERPQLDYKKTDNKYEFISLINTQARQSAIVYNEFMLNNIVKYE